MINSTSIGQKCTQNDAYASIQEGQEEIEGRKRYEAANKHRRMNTQARKKVHEALTHLMSLPGPPCMEFLRVPDERNCSRMSVNTDEETAYPRSAYTTRLSQCSYVCGYESF